MKKIVLLFAIIFSFISRVNAQCSTTHPNPSETPTYISAPSVQWQNQSWLSSGLTSFIPPYNKPSSIVTVNPNPNAPFWFPDKSYQEDWWYDHCNAYTTPTNTTTFLGYMGAGFSHLPIQYDETTNYNSAYGKGCTFLQFPGPVPSPTDNSGCGEWASSELPDIGPPVNIYGLINPNGTTAWINYSNPTPGGYNRIHPLADGNYLAVGATFATRKNMGTQYSYNGVPLYYNPSTASPNNYFQYSQVFIPSYFSGTQQTRTHIDIIKFDKNGNEIFNYIYGPYDFNNPAITNQSATPITLSGNQLAYECGGEAFDFVEESNGTITIVGNATDFSITDYNFSPGSQYLGNLERAFILQIDGTGKLLRKKFLVHSSPISIPADAHDHRSICRAIELVNISGINYYVVAFQDLQDFKHNSSDAKVYIQLLNPTNLTPLWTQTISPSSGLNVNCWDLAVNSSNDIIVPALTNCKGCLYSGKNNQAELKMYLIKPTLTSGTILNNPPPVFQNVEAFDMKARLTNLTGSQNLGIVSTVKTACWSNVYSCAPPSWESGTAACVSDFAASYWNTNAYIAKMNKNGTKFWETNFDVNTSIGPLSCNFPAGFHDSNFPFAGDNVKRQECVYGISEAPDGGLVISGNNSNNFDDNYLVKLYPENCQLPLNYDIYDVNHANNDVIYITGSIVWNSSKKVLGSVHIPAGKSLTITGNSTVIEFAESKYTGITSNIVVEPGGLLHITNGAKLTCIQNCPQAMWDGIILNGTVASQVAANQGVAIINNGTIENARLGILVGDQPNSTSNGAYVQATNSHFLNNYIDVQCNPYSYGSTNQTFFSFCNFIGNKFLNDPSYLGINNPSTRSSTYKHIILDNVQGINFTACNFKTDLTGTLAPSFSTSGRSFGIYSTDAIFTVQRGCNIVNVNGCAGPKSTFENLYYGIFTICTNPLNNFSVTETDFTNCFAGLYENGINYSTITNNNFVVNANIPLPAPFCNASLNNCPLYCHYLNQCEGFTHQDNNYTLSTTQNIAGTIFNNTSSNYALSYRNTYNGLNRGTQLQNGNPNLHVHCNKNSNAQVVDIMVTSGAIPDQGSCVNPPATYANNTFSSVSPFGNLNSVTAFTYYYNPLTSGGPQIPLYHTGVVNLDNCSSGVFPAFNYVRDCPVSVNTGCGTPCQIALVINIQSTTSNLRTPLIIGDDNNLIALIREGNPKEIEAELIAKSPYLSDAVLLELVNHQPQFPENVISNILVANSSLSNNVNTAVEHLSVSSKTRDKIIAAQTKSSVRQELEQKVKYHQDQKEKTFNETVQLLLNDTTSSDGKEKIKQLLNWDNTIKSKIELVHLSISMADYSGAQYLIDSLSAFPELKKLCVFLQHSKNIHQQGKTWHEILKDPAMKNDIVSLAFDSLAIGFANARSVLISVTNAPAYEIIEDINSNNNVNTSNKKMSLTNTKNDATTIKNDEISITAFPNPFKDELTIQINSPENVESVKVQLIEPTTGGLIFEQTVGPKQQSIVFDTSELSSGFYFISVKGQNTQPKFIKVINLR